MAKTSRAAVLKLARRSSVVRPRDLVERGIPRQALYDLVAAGELVRAGRGLYRLPDFEVTENHTLAEVSTRMPAGVICLLSALRFHGLTTELPAEVWVAIDRKAWAPTFAKPRVRLVRLSGPSLSEGIEQHVIEGIRVRVFGVSKTIADCFKFRNKIGTNIAIEALREGWRHRRLNLEELLKFAAMNRVDKILRVYLESIT
jgi:predicted transcriptional regulator of viral defense system